MSFVTEIKESVLIVRQIPHPIYLYCIACGSGFLYEKTKFYNYCSRSCMGDYLVKTGNKERGKLNDEQWKR